MNRIHFDMSLTLDQTDPAGAMASVERIGTTRTLSPARTCGTETFALPPISDTSASVSFIPSGPKMCERTNASHDIPDARSTIVPLNAYITF